MSGADVFVYLGKRNTAEAEVRHRWRGEQL